MTVEYLLTTDDLDEIGHLESPERADPEALLARLLRAVDSDRIADPRDRGYALSLASGIAETELKDLARALDLADRAVEADRASGESIVSARADRARLLHLLGRADEAMAELTALRPLLETDPTASYLVDTLEDTGRVELAERWLTEAARAVMGRVHEPESEEARRAAGAMLYGLVRHRHRIRADLGLPHDDLDDLSDRLDAAGPTPDPAAGTREGLLFWPRADLNALLLRWPALATQLGANWDEHRGVVERELIGLAADGAPGLALVPGSADGFAAHVADGDLDPTDEETVDSYAETLLASLDAMPWPPGRNDPCWCGAGGKYKKCCLPRSRG
ncbi:SEC-C motif-containing protein [Micromonospora haikouensis]|uniref:SEC-C motif-containing protein n=1 Tax=Micromonospora haikouensis TaxID=686309 RepID=A0A1C4VIJ5_9ACTN|nr:SEC-C metal-binding domain-containing protein [Micromonospora haikouensis]SCE83837.1 SEC-C motif-containing protein [Micromonospora haikouensis]